MKSLWLRVHALQRILQLYKDFCTGGSLSCGNSCCLDKALLPNSVFLSLQAENRAYVKYTVRKFNKTYLRKWLR